MKSFILSALLLGAFAMPARAELLNSIDVGLGAAIPLASHQFNQVAETGATFSVEYFRRIAPAVDLGVGVTGLGFGDKVQNTGVASAKFMTSGATFSILSRFFPWPDNTVSPYLAGGIGFAHYAEQADVTPNPGFVWSNTGTNETRRLIDDSSTGFATQLGLGFQAKLSERVFAAVEGDWHFFTVDKDKFGADSVQAMEAGAKIGWRF